MYSLLQRLRSLRHGFWYGVSERMRWSRGAFEEPPAGELCTVNREQAERIAALRDRYQVQFELGMSAATSRNNYAILAWRLPLSLLAPEQLFGRIRQNLRPVGLFFMVNHGTAEAALAERLCVAAGLHRAGHWTDLGFFSRHRMLPPVLSWWRAEVS
jgi:hypothetical protein